METSLRIDATALGTPWPPVLQVSESSGMHLGTSLGIGHSARSHPGGRDGRGDGQDHWTGQGLPCKPLGKTYLRLPTGSRLAGASSGGPPGATGLHPWGSSGRPACCVGSRPPPRARKAVKHVAPAVNLTGPPESPCIGGAPEGKNEHRARWWPLPRTDRDRPRPRTLPRAVVLRERRAGVWSRGARPRVVPGESGAVA